jgi:hypothetical protein
MKMKRKMISFFFIFSKQWSTGGMKLTGENRSTRGKTCPSATLSTTTPTRTNPGSNPGLRGGRPAPNRLSHGTAILSALTKGFSLPAHNAASEDGRVLPGNFLTNGCYISTLHSFTEVSIILSLVTYRFSLFYLLTSTLKKEAASRPKRWEKYPTRTEYNPPPPNRINNQNK